MAPPLQGTQDFSPVLGGPLYQLYLRTRMARPALELLHRRILAFTLFCWLPLLVLSALAGHATGESIHVPFLHDAEAQARFLLALPLLLAAELMVHLRLGPVVRQFVEREVVAPESRPRFEAAIESAMRLRNSVPAELMLIALAFALHPLWLRQLALEAPTWFAIQGTAGLELRPAGIWYAFASIPVFRFLWFRWLFRLGVWARFLWQVSRLELRLLATHPDGAAGLGFLGGSAGAFTPVLAAHGALLSGYLANQIFFAGAKLPQFKMEILGVVALVTLFILGPLCVFTPQLLRARRAGLRSYGLLASRYSRGFDRKWVEGGASPPDELLGSGDIQSLADLATAYGVIKGTRAFPFGKETVIQLAVATALPVAPLVLTMIPLEELVNRLVGVVL